jgi:DNA-binding GntR family transcriptional regulator
MGILISIIFLVSLLAIIERQLQKEKKNREKYLAAEKILVAQFNVSRETNP